jgi:hypothetical protein
MLRVIFTNSKIDLIQAVSLVASEVSAWPRCKDREEETCSQVATDVGGGGVEQSSGSALKT